MRQIDNQSMLDTMAQNQQNAAMISDGGEKPIMKYMEASDAEQKSYPLKYFKGQDLELYYMEKQVKPGVEREIKEGFFEIRKKFGEGPNNSGDEVQVYVNHLCLILGPDNEDIGVRRVCDPGLASVENEVITLVNCLGLHLTWIRASVWFGKTEAANKLRSCQLGNETVLHRLVGIGVDGEYDE